MKLRYKILQKILNTFIPVMSQASLSEVEDGLTTKEELSLLCREVASESIVLLENKGVLPLEEKKIALFGRCQYDWFFAGAGSGGDVKAPYKVNLNQGLKNAQVQLDEELDNLYATWCKENVPFEGFWGMWPRCYEEMPLQEEQIRKIAQRNDLALLVIGRSSGEDRDNKLRPGSWYLTRKEEQLLGMLRREFKELAVIINSGSLMDFTWIKKYQVDAVLLAWQNGQESGNAVADVLTGKTNPCGKLSDTIACYEDYPSAKNFGKQRYNNYTEDIFVGYRYFETFAPEKVLYPFGYGLSYTSFQYDSRFQTEGDKIILQVTVKNTGSYSGKEVLQVYYGSPSGKLGKAKKSLMAFKKTKSLMPGEREVLDFEFTIQEMASFDDTGVSGFPSSYVLEEGDYPLYVGTDVRNASQVGLYHQNKTIQLAKKEIICPVRRKFKRMKETSNSLSYELFFPSKYSNKAKIESNIPKVICSNNYKEYKLSQVKDGSISLDEFVAQLNIEELEQLCRGSNDGMYSPQGVAGNAGVFGGVIPSLKEKGIPVISTNDGPSGARLQCHTTSLPIGTALACTFNPELVQKLTTAVGKEMKERGAMVLLAPGMNIHRSPLCGRNFEYYSEDPYLSGKIAAGYIRGIQENDVSCSIKHFACNNQEWGRMINDARVSQRALREIYLKPFEIAVKEAKPHFVMTAYNKINGIYCYANYDLVTTLLREEWHFDGVVMTDWWILHSKSKENKNIYNHAYRIQAQTDLFMPGTTRFGRLDKSIFKSLRKGGLTYGELQRSVKNVLQFCLKRL